ncbi:MAG: TIGR01777 family oxidoreductase [Flavobacteriales bacterium]
MKILVSGGSGVIGSHLIPMLVARQYEVVNLTTNAALTGTSQPLVKHVYWNPQASELDRDVMKSCDAVVNFAGFSLTNRWTDENKRLMFDSRLQSTKLLCEAVCAMQKPPSIFISASAAGYYEPTAQAVDEAQPAGRHFLSQLCVAWEQAVQVPHDVRTVFMRTALVLSKQGGAIDKMLPFFKLGLGAPVGHGWQPVSWIHVYDVCNFILHTLENQNVKGPYNIASPDVVSNKTFSAALARALRRPFFLPPVPAFVLRILFGEMSQLVLQPQNLNTLKLQQSEFRLKYTKLEDAFAQLYPKQP